ncbi:MAG TPA: hypothetical protein VMT73_08765 [Anaerolineales bacterium]|nr:hypothetical protein [Anaerolineales bacterium]
MSANDENQLKNRQKTKYLWLGYGNYSNSPVPQINSGLVMSLCSSFGIISGGD